MLPSLPYLIPLVLLALISPALGTINTTCPYTQNTANTDQSTFFSVNGINWDAHRIGWVVAGSFAIVTTLITIYSVMTHALHYTNRREQRQIIRILLMPSVYAIISFFSYRFYRDYTYYELVQSAYEALVIGAFFLLLVQFVAATATNLDARKALERKDKQKMPFPFCYFRYRPTKPYFMYTLKWSVLQYCIIRPLLTVVGMITERTGRLCTGSWSPVFASVWIDAIDFVSITVALYGLILFYVLTRSELTGRRPLAKFVSIKLIVFFTFYQGFVFDALADYGVIKATAYWTTENISDGLSALVTCIEMVFFAGLMLWAFPASEYKQRNTKRTNPFRPLWDCINYADFAVEIGISLRFFFDWMRGKPYARAKRHEHEDINQDTGNADFDDAFGIEYDGDGDRQHNGNGNGGARDRDIEESHSPDSADPIHRGQSLDVRPVSNGPVVPNGAGYRYDTGNGAAMPTTYAPQPPLQQSGMKGAPPTAF